MRVTFYGSVLDYTAGENFFEVENCSTVRDLIAKLAGHYGDVFNDFLLGNETCFFLVNGKGLMMTGGLDTPLHPEDRIELLPFTEAG